MKYFLVNNKRTFRHLRMQIAENPLLGFAAEFYNLVFITLSHFEIKSSPIWPV